MPSFDQCGSASINTHRAAAENVEALTDSQVAEGYARLRARKQAFLEKAEKELAKVDQFLKFYSDKVILWLLARQLQNKIARRCFPELAKAPYAARRTTLEYLMECVNEEPESHQSKQFMLYLEHYPRLQRGIEQLEYDGMDMPGWAESLLTDRQLALSYIQQVIDEEYEACPVKEAVEQVLHCLIQLHEEMKEPLFVNETKAGPVQPLRNIEKQT